MDLQRQQKQDYFKLQLKQRCSDVTRDFCNPDTLKEVVFRKHSLKVKSLVVFENLDQKGPELVCY